MYEDRITALYDEANNLYVQAKSVLDEFAEKDMSAEKSAEVDRLLDTVDAKIQEAKRLERAEDTKKALAKPTNERDFFKEPEGKDIKVEWNGRQISGEELAELKALSPFPGFFQAGDGTYETYSKAFRAMLRKKARELSAAEYKDLSAGDAQAGGYLVQDTFVNTLLVKAREVSAMRRIANVLPPVPSGAVIVPSEESLFTDAEWTTELNTGSDDDVKPFGGRRLKPYPLAKRVKVSNTLLRTSTFDAEGYVRDRLAYKFAVPEENAFINGDGVEGPLGILNTPQLPTYTTASSNAIHGNDIINWLYSLPAAYAGRARILCNRAFIRKVRTLYTPEDGKTFTNYLWQPGLGPGQPATILDVPYEVSDRFPTGLDTNDAWKDNAVVAVVGDWSNYWIVDALQLSIQRLDELYAESNQVGFIGRKEADGQAVLAEAFVALRVKA